MAFDPNRGGGDSLFRDLNLRDDAGAQLHAE